MRIENSSKKYENAWGSTWGVPVTIGISPGPKLAQGLETLRDIYIAKYSKRFQGMHFFSHTLSKTVFSPIV